MCGIVGYIGNKQAKDILINGLKRLEYRGYDSAGIATIDDKEGIIRVVKSQGKIAELEKKITTGNSCGHIGIGHTRWATHGRPSEENAHPHTGNNVAVVHNGIIENYKAIKDELIESGHKFISDTDTEVIPHLIEELMTKHKMSKLDAITFMLKRVEGAFALVIIFQDEPNKLIVARRGSPLVIGYGNEEMFIASDSYALAPFTSKICYLEDDDFAIVGKDGAVIYDKNSDIVKREIKISAISSVNIGKENYKHFMLKEIFEQPTSVANVISAYLNPEKAEKTLNQLSLDINNLSKITIVACGTSYYAGMVAKYWIERFTGILVEVDIASEYRYRHKVFQDNSVAIFISQSGETADTVAALKDAKANGQRIISVVNNDESTMAHLSDIVFNIFAGPEIGVASTKAFVNQLLVLAMITVFIGNKRNIISLEEKDKHYKAIRKIPRLISIMLKHHNNIEFIARNFAKYTSSLYVGRGQLYPIALEGALKLKELSYIHAGAIAAGELKHGTIALIDDNLPVVALAYSGDLATKMLSNIEEIASRGGKIILIADKEFINLLPKNIKIESFIEMPNNIDNFIAPIIYTIPVQLLAYFIAVARGTDVDQPRNLAKSVTVE